MSPVIKSALRILGTVVGLLGLVVVAAIGFYQYQKYAKWQHVLASQEAYQQQEESAAPPVAVAAVAPAPVPGLTDANIAAIVVAANNADISYAEQALAKTQDADVRSFATMVRSDHQSVNRAAVALVTRLKVTPVDNQLSFDLRDDAETKRLRMRDLEGFAFDSAYAANEVSYHVTLLGAIDSALIPSARNSELKALLVEVRPAVEAHLGHAKQLAATKTVRRR